jgi:general transcription factor 3C polypeptide 3 (transcription factor C subunit 4)
MESKGSEIDEFEKALESALDGSTEEEEEDENEEREYSDDDGEEEDDDDDDDEEEEENALDSMEQNQQFEYEALAEKKRKTLADAKGLVTITICLLYFASCFFFFISFLRT